jgi:hypothetical protein
MLIQPETLLPWLLVVQGLMGGADTLFNHEIVERLPQRVEARGEIALHALREAIYGTLFVALAWSAWHGVGALAIAALVVAEVIVTATDELVENRIRVMPQNERALHVLLTLNLGLIVAVLVPVLRAWAGQPTERVPVDHGALSVALTLLGLASWAWSIRDARAWRRLRREAAALAATTVREVRTPPHANAR